MKMTELIGFTLAIVGSIEGLFGRYNICFTVLLSAIVILQISTLNRLEKRKEVKNG